LRSGAGDRHGAFHGQACLSLRERPLGRRARRARVAPGEFWHHAATFAPVPTMPVAARPLVSSVLLALAAIAGAHPANAAIPGMQAVAPAAAAPAAAPATVVLPMPWKDGVHVAYRSVATQDKLRGGKHLVLATHETLVIDVIEANAAGTVLRWSNTAPRVEASGDAPALAAEKAVVEALASRFGRLPYEVTLDPAGEFTGLRNWQSLAAAMREVMLPALVAQAKARPELAGQTDAALQARFAPLLDRMSNQAGIDASLGREAALFNFFVGASLRPGGKREYDDTVASPWSADLLPTHGSVELVAQDATTATLHWTQSIDPVKGKAVVLKSIESLAGKPAPAEVRDALVAGVRLDDEATVVVERASGLPLRLDHRREIVFGEARTSNRWTLERVPAE
jgi:hypothetical protein